MDANDKEIENLQTRIFLFLFVCITIRAYIAYYAKSVSIDKLPYLGYGALVIMIGFIYIYISGSRKTGAEVFGGKIWWDGLRPLHALLYGLFAYHAINKIDYSWKFLAADVYIGLINFFIYHTIEGNFTKIYNPSHRVSSNILISLSLSFFIYLGIIIFIS